MTNLRRVSNIKKFAIFYNFKWQHLIDDNSIRSKHVSSLSNRYFLGFQLFNVELRAKLSRDINNFN